MFPRQLAIFKETIFTNLVLACFTTYYIIMWGTLCYAKQVSGQWTGEMSCWGQKKLRPLHLLASLQLHVCPGLQYYRLHMIASANIRIQRGQNYWGDQLQLEILMRMWDLIFWWDFFLYSSRGKSHRNMYYQSLTYVSDYLIILWENMKIAAPNCQILIYSKCINELGELLYRKLQND